LAAGWLLFFGWSMIENKIRGPIPASELASILNRSDLGRLTQPDKLKQFIEKHAVQGCPQRAIVKMDSLGIPEGQPWYLRPGFFDGIAIVLLTVLMVWWW